MVQRGNCWGCGAAWTDYNELTSVVDMDGKQRLVCEDDPKCEAVVKGEDKPANYREIPIMDDTPHLPEPWYVYI